MTLSNDTVREMIHRVTYRDWLFYVEDTPYEGLRLWIETDQPDARHPGQDVKLRIDSYLPPFNRRWDVLEWLTWRLCRIATHEVREFLRYDGQIIDDPHEAA